MLMYIFEVKGQSANEVFKTAKLRLVKTSYRRRIDANQVLLLFHQGIDIFGPSLAII